MWSGTFLLVLLLWSEPHLGIARHVVQYTFPFTDIHNLGSRISADVQQRLAPLHNLGAQIEEQVEKSLMPVYALAIKKDMADGIGGTTIATYSGSMPRSFIIRNGHRSVCNGTIRRSRCDGTLEPFKMENREDYCYASSYAVVDNIICLSSDPITIISNNNDITCNSASNSPTLILTRNEFQNLCGDVTSRQIVYNYYANSHDPRAIPIPNSNPYVKCRNNKPRACVFEEDNEMSSNSNISNRNNVFIRGGNINISSVSIIVE